MEEDRKSYLDEMLRRLEQQSLSVKNTIETPSPLYHASIRKNLTVLDPAIGQGLGIWLLGDLRQAAHFCVSRATDPRAYPGSRYIDADPSIYEVRATMSRIAVFPNEVSLYHFYIEQDHDPAYYPLYSMHTCMHDTRDLLLSEGYNAIHLLAEGTFSVIQADAIEIVQAHDPFPIYNRSIRDGLIKRFRTDPYPWVPRT